MVGLYQLTRNYIPPAISFEIRHFHYAVLDSGSRRPQLYKMFSSVKRDSRGKKRPSVWKEVQARLTIYFRARTSEQQSSYYFFLLELDHTRRLVQPLRLIPLVLYRNKKIIIH